MGQFTGDQLPVSMRESDAKYRNRELLSQQPSTGVLIIGVLNTGMQLVGLQDFYQLVVKGVILLAAVGFDTYQKSRKARETFEKAAA